MSPSQGYAARDEADFRFNQLSQSFYLLFPPTVVNRSSSSDYHETLRKTSVDVSLYMHLGSRLFLLNNKHAITGQSTDSLCSVIKDNQMWSLPQSATKNFLYVSSLHRHAL